MIKYILRYPSLTRFKKTRRINLKKNIKLLILNAIIASLYIIINQIFYFLSFDAVQFRIAEVLMILILFNVRYIYGLTLGVAIANLFSPMGLIDVGFGTLATFVALLLIVLLKKVLKPYLVYIFLPLVNGIIIGLMIKYFYAPELNLYLCMLYVFIGEFLVIYLLGIPIYYLLNGNQKFRDFLIIDDKNDSKNFYFPDIDV